MNLCEARKIIKRDGEFWTFCGLTGIEHKAIECKNCSKLIGVDPVKSELLCKGAA